MKRGAFAALVVAAVLIPLRKSRVTMQETVAEGSTEDSLFDLSWARRMAERNAAAFGAQDSLMPRLAALPRGGVPPVVISGFGGADSAPSAVNAVRHLWSHVHATDSTIRVGVLVYGPSRMFRDYSGTWIAFDSATAVATCVALVPAWRDYRTHQITTSGVETASDLAPCAVLATFGVPGPGVMRWLLANRFAQVGSNAWLRPEPQPYPDPWANWWRPETGELPQWLVSSIVLVDAAAVNTPPYSYGANGLRCIAGVESACADAVLRPDVVIPPATTLPPQVTLAPEEEAPHNVDFDAVRPPQESWLAAMIARFGAQRFARFWHSTLPFDAAFRDAFGVSVGSATRQWAQAQWSETQYTSLLGHRLVLGADVRVVWIAGVAFWSGFALLAAFAVARRRQS